MRIKLIVGIVLIGAGFLIGFIPQHSQVEDLRAQRASNTQQLQVAQNTVRAASVQIQLLLAYFEVTRKNYGLASEHAMRFFQASDQLAVSMTDPTAKKAWQGILESRDSIRGELAQGNPAVLEHLQAVIQQVQTAVQGQMPE